PGGDTGLTVTSARTRVGDLAEDRPNTIRKARTGTATPSGWTTGLTRATTDDRSDPHRPQVPEGRVWTKGAWPSFSARLVRARTSSGSMTEGSSGRGVRHRRKGTPDNASPHDRRHPVRNTSPCLSSTMVEIQVLCRCAEARRLPHHRTGGPTKRGSPYRAPVLRGPWPDLRRADVG